MEAAHKKHITRQHALLCSAAAVLLVLLVWKSNLEKEILLPFLILGITFAVILCLIKRIDLPKPLIIFSGHSIPISGSLYNIPESPGA